LQVHITYFVGKALMILVIRLEGQTMRKQLITGLVRVVGVALLLALPGCGNKPGAGRSTLTSEVGGRVVVAIIDGPAFISSEGDTAVVSFGPHKLVVEKERILLDGQEQAKVPTGAKKVEVKHVAGKLTATADGAAVEIAGQAK
jgi:hypothetical protein